MNAEPISSGKVRNFREITAALKGQPWRSLSAIRHDIGMPKNTSNNVLLRKIFKRSRKELRDTLRALYRNSDQRPPKSVAE